MANQDLINLVCNNLPTWREELTNWNFQKIGDMLDLYGSDVPQVCRLFWLQRVSDTQPFVDVSENGSTASQSQDHAQAVAMLAYWDKQLTTGSRTSIGKIKKRYARPKVTAGLDDWGYGGPYAKTD